MRVVFWVSVALVGYTYIGYAAWLSIRSRFRPRPVRLAAHTPFISVVLIVRNEAAVLEDKLHALLTMDYPDERVEIVVVSDGSLDGTNEILSRFASNARVHITVNREHLGKASGLNAAIDAVSGEFVVFTDARQKMAKDAVLHLMENFADPDVGCASGELSLGDPVSGEMLKGMGLYWRVEKSIREMESRSGSVVGATGALYAVRRSLLVPLPPETILDDVLIPMQVVRQGARVVLDPRARIWDTPDLGTRREFSRKVRTLSGIYQLLKLEPWLWGDANPLRFEFISHKLLRLVVPFALCAALFSSFFLPALIYRSALTLQLLFYALGAWGTLAKNRNPAGRIADAARTFVLLNLAAVVAFANFIVGRKPAWSR